jgi:hypothetical protein
MSPPDPGGMACAKFSSNELEKTFFYPGPQDLSTAPGKFARRAWTEAKEVCIECPLYLACREVCWGEEYGVWGGTDQHERYLYRRRLVKHLARMGAQERAAEAARLFAMPGAAGGRSLEAISRQTGYSVQTIRVLLAEHVARLKAEREAAGQAAREAVGWAPAARFPERAPRGDAWVIQNGTAYPGRYIGQTASGRWLRMSMQVGGRIPAVRWFRAENVDLREQVEIVALKKGEKLATTAENGLRSGQQAAPAA